MPISSMVNIPLAFQSTPPVWGATVGRPRRLQTSLFQSTPPVWGATKGKDGKDLDLVVGFQSTPPVWGATSRRSMPVIRFTFQSTPPVWGATTSAPAQEPEINISIHAPRVGGDCLRPPGPVSLSYFNPRPPCGGRRLPRPGLRGEHRISIHAPRVGGDSWTRALWWRRCHFNPRPPCGGRQQKQLKIQAVRAKNRQFLQISSPNSYPILKNKVASLQIILQNLVRDLGDFLRVYVSHLKHQYIFWVVGCLYSKMLDLVFIAVSQVIKTKTVLFRVHDLTQLCL